MAKAFLPRTPPVLIYGHSLTSRCEAYCPLTQASLFSSQVMPTSCVAASIGSLTL